MDLRRVRVWEWLTGLSGLALLVALFLPWYGDANAWEAMAVIDVVLALAGLAAIAYVIVHAAQRTAAVPQTMSQLIMPLVIVAVILAAVRVADAPDVADGGRGEGAGVGLLAALALFACVYRSMGHKRLPENMRPKHESRS